MPPLPQVLAELAPDMARLAAPVVEQVAQRLSEGQGTKKQPLTVPTLLTEANRRAGRNRVRVKPKGETKSELTVPRACTACGVVLERRDREHCDECLPEETRRNAMAFREAGRARLEALRAAGEDPAHSETANRLRNAKMIHHRREFREWNAKHAIEEDPEVFHCEILPGLQSISLGEMAKVTGLSVGYCSFVRRGLKVPHPRHWKRLRGIAD